MIDFWEVFGRLTTNDTLRNSLYARFSAVAYSAPKSGWATIPQKNYTDAGTLLGAVVPGPLSIFCLGEILWALSSKTFRDGLDELAASVQAAGVITANRSPWFYTALGVMSVDGQVLGDFAQGGQKFDDNNFSVLTKAERDDITQLACDADVMLQAKTLCQTLWGQGCLDKLQFWEPDAQHPHLHPVANPYPV